MDHVKDKTERIDELIEKLLPFEKKETNFHINKVHLIVTVNVIHHNHFE